MTGQSSPDQTGETVREDDLIRVRLDIGYDGSEFSGWARQSDRRTVQGVIEDALAVLVARSGPFPVPVLTCAGRTDAGVHARGQVAHLDLPPAIWHEGQGRRLAGQLNANLTDEVRIFRARAVPAEFDARFSALTRTYTYRICDDPMLLDPITRNHVVASRRPLDLGAMNLAARELLGEHDFAAFCRRREGASSVRTLLRLGWTRDENRLAVMTIESDAFCHSMVRAIVGALVAVGEGRRDPEWPGQVLRRGERDSAVMVMRPEGLVLESVSYPTDALLGRQARAARRFRGPEQSRIPG